MTLSSNFALKRGGGGGGRNNEGGVTTREYGTHCGSLLSHSELGVTITISYMYMYMWLHVGLSPPS